MKLVAFDGDNTLWSPLSGVNLCDRTPTDGFGEERFTYRPVAGRDRIIQRDDGALFEMRPEARGVLRSLRKAGILTGVISYNHLGPVERALEAFGVRELFDYVVAEWHTNKDAMLRRMISLAELDGRRVDPAETMLVDDDPDGLYVEQFARMGAQFRRFGHDITDLSAVLPLAGVVREK